jgi:hypothetical protein
MLEWLLASIALVSAVECVLQLRQLDHLFEEFHDYAEKTSAASTGLIQALLHQESLDSHQRILRTQAMVASAVLMLYLSCLTGVVLISL